MSAKQLDPELKRLIDEYGRLVTYPQAAKITAASTRTLKRETAAGRLPCYKVGEARVLRVKTADLFALIRRVA